MCSSSWWWSKKKELFIDNFRRVNSFGYIIKILKTPFYTSFLGLVVFQNGLSSYILLADNLYVGSRIFCGALLRHDKLNEIVSIGSSVPLLYTELFSLVSNIELIPYFGGLLARAAGSSVIVTAKLDDKILLKSKSGWNFLISKFVIATIGASSNVLYKFTRIGKAGKNRALGIRPTIRGVAMNPCDHPHGGGEGRKSPSVAARSPWGWLTKNTPSKITKGQLVYKKLAKVVR